MITDVMVPWSYEGAEVQSPGGVLIGWTCDKLGIPFVFCTSGYHHGPSYQWVDTFTRLNKWPRMIDGQGVRGEQDKNEKKTKNWVVALSRLLKRVNQQ